MKIKSFFIETFGCQMNEYDSQLLESLMISSGFTKTQDERSADLVIFNTCSVRHKAEERALGRIRSASGKKNQKQIAVVGCMAQRMGNDLLKENKDIKYVLGTDNFHKLVEILNSENSEVIVDTSCRDEPLDLIAQSSVSKYSSSVTIMRGCNNFCTYCIVPYVRGRERFRPPHRIVEEINNLEQQGCQELWLLGQNVNSYQHEDLNFPQLLKFILAETSLPRIRFLTSHPKDFSNQLIDMMAENKRICNGIHLPMQSGSDKILKKMNRKYASQDYLENIRKLKEKIPEVILTTDIIVGFPGETEQDYQNTKDIMQQIKFNAAFMFRYSVRSGTKAEKFGDDVPEQVKLTRLDDLIRFQKEISESKMSELVGTTQEVLLEELSRQDKNDVRGKSDGGLNVVVRNTGSDLGKIVTAKILSSSYTTLVGELTSG